MNCAPAASPSRTTCLSVVGVEVDLPRVVGGHVAHVAHPSGHGHSPAREHEVSAETRGWALGPPSEHLAVEPSTAFDVRRPQIGPARRSHRSDVAVGPWLSPFGPTLNSPHNRPPTSGFPCRCGASPDGLRETGRSRAGAVDARQARSGSPRNQDVLKTPDLDSSRHPRAVTRNGGWPSRKYLDGRSCPRGDRFVGTARCAHSPRHRGDRENETLPPDSHSSLARCHLPSRPQPRVRFPGR